MNPYQHRLRANSRSSRLQKSDFLEQASNAGPFQRRLAAEPLEERWLLSATSAVSAAAVSGSILSDYFAAQSASDKTQLSILPTGITSLTVGPQIAVTGNGVAIADGATTTSTANGTVFTAANIGGVSSAFFTIQNTGDTLLSTGPVTFSGANPGDFSVSSNFGISVPAGRSALLIVQFSPTSFGTRNAVVSFSENDSTQANPFTFAISGVGLSPHAIITGNGQAIADGGVTASVSNQTVIGAAMVGKASSVTYTVNNAGTSALSLGGATLRGTNASDFLVTAQPASSVAAGASTSFTIQFRPSAVGTRTATVSLSDNDSTQANPYTFAISGLGATGQLAVVGNGQLIADSSTTPSSSNGTAIGGTLANGSSTNVTYTLFNAGSTPLTLGVCHSAVRMRATFPLSHRPPVRCPQAVALRWYSVFNLRQSARAPRL